MRSERVSFRPSLSVASPVLVTSYGRLYQHCLTLDFCRVDAAADEFAELDDEFSDVAEDRIVVVEVVVVAGWMRLPNSAKMSLTSPGDGSALAGWSGL